MFENLKELCLLYGVSGDEKNVRDFILDKIKDKCECRTDTLGNIIAFKKGKKTPDKKLMLAAHMDEVGLIITHINDDGTLQFDTVGGINDDVIIGRQIILYNKNIYGVVGAKAIHNIPSEELGECISVSDLYIDIGAKDKHDAQRVVSKGDYVSFTEGFLFTENGYIRSKAIDDRAGCAILIDIINSETEFDMYFAFTVQEEIGLRGATTAAYQIAPDYALVLESTTASDTSIASGAKRVCELGDGAVIAYSDKRTVYDRQMYELAFEVAKENELLCQTKTLIAGGNDSGAIHISGNGVRTLSISVPCRYIHSPTSVAKFTDIFTCQVLAKKLIPKVFEL